MSENLDESKQVAKKKAPAKKAAVKKEVATKASAAPIVESTGKRIIVFESGSSYTSNGIRFTKDNRIQEVPEADAEILLQQENFRLPTQFEVDDYLASRED